jgi:hypothetical protein
VTAGNQAWHQGGTQMILDLSEAIFLLFGFACIGWLIGVAIFN